MCLAASGHSVEARKDLLGLHQGWCVGGETDSDSNGTIELICSWHPGLKHHLQKGKKIAKMKLLSRSKAGDQRLF